MRNCMYSEDCIIYTTCIDVANSFIFGQIDQATVICFRAFAQFKIAASKLTAIVCRHDGSTARIYGDHGPGEVGL